MAVFLPPDQAIVDKTCQRPQYHHTIAVYKGKDNASGLRAHFGAMALELKMLMQCGFFWEWQHSRVRIILPADMSVLLSDVLCSLLMSHWGLFGCGGIHDQQFCHHCTELQCDRHSIYEYHTLGVHPSNPGG
eukprot:944573-Rhodomonas_salina.1